MAKLATTGPWNGSRKGTRKTHGRSKVVLGLVDQGLIIGVSFSLATSPVGTARALACGPTIASTLSWVISLVAAAVADSGLDSLSSMINLMLYFLPPTSRPPAPLISSRHISAARLD